MRAIFVIGILLSTLLGCHTDSPPQTSSGTLDVSIAPFNALPPSADFSIKIRFSKPITKIRRTSNPSPNVKISPVVEGYFSWLSDSEISFFPLKPLPADFAFDIDLRGLELPANQALSTNILHGVTPTPNVILDGCMLQNVSQDPVVKRFSGKFSLNYALDGYWQATFDERSHIEEILKNHLHLSRKLANSSSEEVVMPFTTDVRSSSIEIEAQGTDMLRPGSDGKVHLTLEPGLLATGGKPFPGADCEVSFADVDWRTELSSKLSDSEAEKKPKAARVSARFGNQVYATKTIALGFVDPASPSITVSHKRPEGEIVEHGIVIDPPVLGKWQITSNSTLSFAAEKTWLPGQTYKISVDPKEFPELFLSETVSTIVAPAVSALIANVDSGTVPEEKAKRVVSAELDFNYPVDPEALEKLTHVEVSEKGKKQSTRSVHFSIQKLENSNTIFIKSEPLELQNYPLIIDFKLTGSVVSSVGGTASDLKLSKTFELPSRLDIFSISDAELSVAKSAKEELQRIVTISTSEDVDEGLVSQALEIQLLPDCKNKANRKLCHEENSFSNELQVLKEVEAASEKIPVTFVTRSENGGEETFSYSFQAPGGRQALIKVNSGLTSKLGFPLAKSFREVVHVPDYPTRLSIMSDGALLSLSGTRRVGILAQNVKKIKYRLSRVKAQDLHHMVFAASGGYAKPSFYSQFTLDDMAQPVNFVEDLPEGPSGKPAYTSVDLSQFSVKGETPRGLFFLEVDNGDKPVAKSDEDESQEEDDSECDEDSGDCSDDSSDAATVAKDSRLILLTDLGLVVKRDLAGNDKVFVASFRKGEPVGGAQVKLVSRNGTALFTAVSNSVGEVQFPKADEFAREKKPVMYVAEKDGDLTFIPYDKRDREVMLSRFNIGGVFNVEEPDALRAMIFSDRGIYRPGETAHFALTVRTRDLGPNKAELPLTVRVTDPRGQTVDQEVLTFPKSGVSDFTFETKEAGMTGTYHIALVIPARGKKEERSLFQLEFRVEEFEPDRLAITAELGAGDLGMFEKLEDLQGFIKLKNLFGAPAAGNTVKANLIVDAWDGALAAYPEFNFRLMPEDQNFQHSTIDLGEVTTNDEGNANFAIEIPDVSGVVLRTRLTAEGFEKDSGRSVATNTVGLVTDLDSLLGVKTTDDLEFVGRGAARKISLQAINLKGEKKPLKKLKVNLEREDFKNILVKQSNGVFKYESAKKLTPLSSNEIDLTMDIYEYVFTNCRFWQLCC